MGLRTFVVSVTTPGTPQNLAKAINASLPQVSGVLAGPVELRATAIVFQADPSNSASKKVYVGDSTLAVATPAGIGLALTPGTISPAIVLDGTTSINDFWFDIDTGATTKNLYVTVIG